MKRWILLFVLVFGSFCSADWDPTKPADTRAWDLRDDDCRANFAALGSILGISSGASEPNMATVFNVKAFGAEGDGTTDDTDALNDAIDAAEAVNGCLYIPNGKYRYTSQITITSPIKIIGESMAAILWPDLDDSNVDSWVMGSVSATTRDWVVWDVLWANDDADDHRDTVVFNRCMQARVRIESVAGGSRWGVRTAGCIYGVWDIKVMIPIYDWTVTRPAYGVLFEDIPGTMACNANWINVQVQSVEDIAFRLFGTPGSGTPAVNNFVTGSFESMSASTPTYMIHLDGCQRTVVQNIYAAEASDDPNLVIDTSSRVSILGCKVNAIDMVDADNCILDNIHLTKATGGETLNIDSSSSGNVLGLIQTAGNALDINDLGVGTIYRGPIVTSAAANNPYLNIQLPIPVNHAENGNFNSWTTNYPVNWSDPAGCAWTQCGTGLTTTTNRGTDYCAQLVNTAGAQIAPTYTLPNSTLLLARWAGQWCSLSYWIYQASTVTTQPYMRVRVTAGSNYNYYTYAYKRPVKDTWTKQYTSFYVPASSTAITFTLFVPEDMTIYLSEFSIQPSSHGMAGWTPTLPRTIDAQTTWDPASIADGDEEVKDVTCEGAAMGDFVTASFSLDVADLTLTASVTDPNVVGAQLSNSTGGAIDLASGTVYVRVWKK